MKLFLLFMLITLAHAIRYTIVTVDLSENENMTESISDSISEIIYDLKPRLI